MSRVAPILFATLLLLSAGDAAATWVRPDTQFAFSLPAADAKDALNEIAAALELLNFKLTLNPPPLMRKDGFIGAEFWGAHRAAVTVSGFAACVRVAIYTSSPSQAHEQSMSDAAELSAYLVSHLRSREGVLLFKSSGARATCEEAL